MKEKKALLRQTKKEAKAPEEPLPIPQDETDLPMEDIMRKPGEERQKIFYQMLIKGEELLKLGNIFLIYRALIYSGSAEVFFQISENGT